MKIQGKFLSQDSADKAVTTILYSLDKRSQLQPSQIYLCLSTQLTALLTRTMLIFHHIQQSGNTNGNSILYTPSLPEGGQQDRLTVQLQLKRSNTLNETSSQTVASPTPKQTAQGDVMVPRGFDVDEH